MNMIYCIYSYCKSQYDALHVKFMLMRTKVVGFGVGFFLVNN